MAAFHYVVKVKLIRRNKENGGIEFVQDEKTFQNESPSLARNLAFRYYQSYVDVLLQAKNKNYYSDKQTREEFKSFIDPGTTTRIQVGENEIELSDSLGNGIGIFLIIDIPMPENVYDDKEGDEIFIHGIGNISFVNDDPDRLISELQREYEFYSSNHLQTDNKVIEVLYCSREEWEEGYKEDEPETYNLLETPFDWTGFDKPYWWVSQSNEIIEEIQQAPKTIQELIQEGESNQVEFKPALLYNFSTKKGGIGVKGIIAKAICAFLNSNGGFLFIGVTDKGIPQGLSYDFSLSQGKNEKDFFMLEYDQMLEYFLSFSVKGNASGQFFRLDDKDIFVVTVTPSKHRPIFLNGQNGKEFYVRGEASSRQLTDIEELANYCIEKWGRQ